MDLYIVRDFALPMAGRAPGLNLDGSADTHLCMISIHTCTAF